MRKRKSDKSKTKRYKSGKPFTMPRDFSSKGVTTRQQDDGGKEQVLFSKLESEFDLIFYYTTKLLKCENNAPILPMSITQRISKTQSITHPKDENGDDVTMTTDFLLTIEVNNKIYKLAVSIKYSKDLDRRTIEKMNLEKIAREKEGRIWVLLTERQIDKLVFKTLKFISDFKIKPDDYHDSILDEFILSRSKNISLSEFAGVFSKKYKIQKGDCLRSFYHLIATRKIVFDFTRELNGSLGLKEFSLAA